MAPAKPTVEKKRRYFTVEEANKALPLVRNITKHAYRAGASLVTTLLSDEEATLLRFREARDLSVSQEDALVDTAVFPDQQESHRERAGITGPQVLHGCRYLKRLTP